MLRAGQGVMLGAGALLATGVVMINSAGASLEQGGALGLDKVLLGRNALLAALAATAMVAGARVPLQRLERAMLCGRWFPWIGAGVVLLLLAVHAPVVGREVNGARRWIDLGLFSFQPSEIAKWAMVLLLASWSVRHAKDMARFRVGFAAPMAFAGLVCALVATEDLGTAVLIGAVAALMLLVAGARPLHAALLAAPAGLALAAAIITSPYRLDRLRAFIDPWKDPQGIGYHMIQSMVTVAGGAVAGRGLGNGLQKFGYLPEDTTDFIFAVICEETGLAGAALLVFLYGVLLWCGAGIVRGATTPFQRLLGLGILLTVGLQALVNMAVVTGLAPTKGIALPLVSAGGTGWVLTAFCLGLLVGCQQQNLVSADARIAGTYENA
jgi:cell division protein FtsW